MSTATLPAPAAPATDAAAAAGPTFTRQGDTAILVLDAATTAALGIEPGTPLKVTVDGQRLVVEPAPQPADDRAARFQDAMRATAQENAELFHRLAR